MLANKDFKYFDLNFHNSVEPVLDVNRPLWSVIIPIRNCANHLKTALNSIEKQFPGTKEMEIIVVDDASDKDDPIGVISKYNDLQINYIKHEKRVGKSQNYLAGIKKAKGRLIHLLHGDDEVLNGFYKKFEEIFKKYSNIGAAFCPINYINTKGEITGHSGYEQKNDGVLSGFLEKIIISQRIQPPSMVIKRSVYENIGTYDNRLAYMEDWEMYVRTANFYEIGYTPDTLANYRIHPSGSHQTSIRKGKRIKTIRQVINIVDNYIEPSVIKKTRKKRNQAQAFYLIQYIPKVIQIKDINAYIKVIISVLRFYTSAKTLYYIFYFSFFWKKLK